jgi:hypothetical protein
MTNIELQTEIKQIAHCFRLTPAQVSAAFQYLESDKSLAFLEQYALGDVMGLSLSQWLKLKNSKAAQVFLGDLNNNSESSHTPFSMKKFIAHDHNFLKSLSLPMSLASFPREKLLAVIEAIFQNRDVEPLQILKDNLNVEDGQVLKDLSVALLLKLIGHENILCELRNDYWNHAHAELVLPSKAHEAVQTLNADWPNPTPELKKINPSVLQRFFELHKSLGLKLNFIHPQGIQSGYEFIAKTLNWSSEDKVADKWIEDAIHFIWDAYLVKILHRDLMALLYDQMVEQALPLAELKLKQYLMFSGIGSKNGLLIYPHGRSGVMLLAVDTKGEALDETMIYPYAPDYNSEHTLSHFAKIFIKYNIQDVGLIIKPETKKTLLKSLMQVKERYTDLDFNIHYLPGELTQVFQTKNSKQPLPEDILSMAHFMQHPFVFWNKLSPQELLPHVFKVLPKALLKEMWSGLLHSHLLKTGIDINSASAEHLGIITELSSEKIEKLIANRPFTKREDIGTALELNAEDLSLVLPYLKINQEKLAIDSIPLSIELESLLKNISKESQLSLDEICKNPALLNKSSDDELTKCLEKHLVSYQLTQKPISILLSKELLSDDKALVGQWYQGVVTKVMPYGLFIELTPGVEGLLHISALGDIFVNDLNLLFHAGDTLVVEWGSYDTAQKRLSLKYPFAKEALTVKHEKITPKNVEQHRPRKHFKSKSQETLKPKKIVSEPKNQAPNAMQMAFAKLTNKSD